MHVLIIKMSSLGDILHTLPALSDAYAAIPNIQFDWVVEDSFAEIPAWHPAVNTVIPINFRHWAKRPFYSWWKGASKTFKQQVREQYYDMVIDAQGLLKSAWVMRQTRCLSKVGLDKHSAREPFASWFYQKRIHIPKEQHAIHRVRQLFAQALGYDLPTTSPDYGISTYTLTTLMPSRPTLLFLHGTTWDTKHWPESYWLDLAQRATKAGFNVLLPWGNEAEKARAGRIADTHQHIKRLPACSLQGLASKISTAIAVVGVDTGLVHLAAALRTPSLSLYGATEPKLTGTMGQQQIHLQANFNCAPCLKRHCHYQGKSAVQPACYATLDVDRTWAALMQLIATQDDIIL